MIELRVTRIDGQAGEPLVIPLKRVNLKKAQKLAKQLRSYGSNNAIVHVYLKEDLYFTLNIYNDDTMGISISTHVSTKTPIDLDCHSLVNAIQAIPVVIYNIVSRDFQIHTEIVETKAKLRDKLYSRFLKDVLRGEDTM